MQKIWIDILLVGAGGFIGAAARYALTGAVQRLTQSSFPFGTIVVNVVGCLAIGVLAGVADARQLMKPGVRLFLAIGILGGFTTFSTFSYETLALFREGEALRAAANVVASVVLCLAFVWLGYTVANGR